MDGEETVRRAFSGTFIKRHGHGHVTVTFSVKNERFTVSVKKFKVYLNLISHEI
jgi:hypothetical protein